MKTFVSDLVNVIKDKNPEKTIIPSFFEGRSSTTQLRYSISIEECNMLKKHNSTSVFGNQYTHEGAEVFVYHDQNPFTKVYNPHIIIQGQFNEFEDINFGNILYDFESLKNA